MRDRFWGTFRWLHVHLRALTPCVFDAYSREGGFQFSWKEVTFRRLWAVIWRRDHWECRLRFARGVNGRCYCDAGWRARWFLRVAGFGWQLWLGHHGGPFPCPCDEACESFEEGSELEG